jgi:DNA invertase Pin-like site-specific DNA recombinase
MARSRESLQAINDPELRRSRAPAEDGQRWAGRGRPDPRAAHRARTAVAYLRRSTDRQEQSIPDQKRAVEAYSAEHELNLVRCYVDDAISGTSALGRKAFQQMMTDAQAPACDFGVVVCYDVKRFGRVDNDEAGYYRHLLRTHGVEVAYASENFTGDSTDDLLRPVKQWQARQESKDLSKVTIRGLLSRVGSGWWMGGVPPHGYDLAYENDRSEFLFILRHMPDGSKQVLDRKGKAIRTLARGESLSISKRDRARLVPGHTSRVETIQRIFKLYREGRGLKAVSDTLNRSGTPTPRGSAWSHIYAGLWRDSTIRAILVNPIYVGDMVWNRRTDARFHMIAGNGEGQSRAVERRHPHGARLVPNDKADWIVIRGTHEGLISRKAFLSVQAAMAGRGNGAAKENGGRAVGAVGGWSGARSRFILSGLVRCGRCGGRHQGVTRTKGKRRNDGTKVRTYSYACGSYIAKGTKACSYNPVSQEVLERAVIDAVLEHYARYRGAAGLERLTREVREGLGVESQDLAAARERLDAQTRQIETKIANLLDHVTAANRDLVDERLELLRRDRAGFDARREELALLASRQTAVQDQVRELARFLDGLEFTLRHGLNVEQMAALRRCVEHVTVDRQAGTGTVSLRSLVQGGSGGRIPLDL